AVLPSGADRRYQSPLYGCARPTHARCVHRLANGRSSAAAGADAVNWLAAGYPWLKSLHIIAVIAWMAGLLYLPRLFVYHAGVPMGSDQAAIFEVMERRLLHAIMAPALVMTYGFGLLLLAVPGAVDWR